MAQDFIEKNINQAKIPEKNFNSCKAQILDQEIASLLQKNGIIKCSNNKNIISLPFFSGTKEEIKTNMGQLHKEKILSDGRNTNSKGHTKTEKLNISNRSKTCFLSHTTAQITPEIPKILIDRENSN